MPLLYFHFVGTDLHGLISEHLEHADWGVHAQKLIGGNGFEWPAQGVSVDIYIYIYIYLVLMITSWSEFF